MKKLMLRDFTINKAQFVSIFLMVFIAMFVFTGVSGEAGGLKKSIDSFYEQTNQADAYIYGENLSEKTKDEIASLANIAKTERRLKLATIGEMEDEPKINLFFTENGEINKPYLVEGEAYGGEVDGVWLSARFASSRGLKVGDTLTVKYGEAVFSKEIKGLVLASEYIYNYESSSITPDYYRHGYGFIPSQFFPNPSAFQYNELLVRYTNREIDDAKIEKEIDEKVSDGIGAFLALDNHPSHSVFTDEIAQHRAMGNIFPVIFVAVAMLTILTTMKRMVDKERQWIGTLKALGFSNAKVVLHFASYGLVISLPAATLGAVLGPFIIAPLFFPSMSSFYALPVWQVSYNMSFVWVLVVMIAACVLTTLLASYKTALAKPASALRTSFTKTGRKLFFERTGWFKKLGFNARYALRDIFRNPVRSIMAVVGAFGCSMLLVCAFTMYSSMHELKTELYGEVLQFNQQLTLQKDITYERADELRDKYTGELVMKESIEIKFADTKTPTILEVLEDNSSLIQSLDKNRETVDLPKDGFSITRRLADKLAVKKGDKISWRPYGSAGWTDEVVSQIYVHPSEQGAIVFQKYFEQSDFSFTPTSIVTNYGGEISDDLVASTESIAELETGWDELTKSFNLMVYVVTFAAILLSVVVIYDLGILAFSEVQHEFATLKVIGIKARALIKLLLTQNLWLSSIGFFLGIPVGKYITELICAMSGDAYDIGVILLPWHVIVSAVITIGLVLVVSIFFYRPIKKIDMVSSLKSGE